MSDNQRASFGAQDGASSTDGRGAAGHGDAAAGHGAATGGRSHHVAAGRKPRRVDGRPLWLLLQAESLRLFFHWHFTRTTT